VPLNVYHKGTSLKQLELCFSLRQNKSIESKVTPCFFGSYSLLSASHEGLRITSVEKFERSPMVLAEWIELRETLAKFPSWERQGDARRQGEGVRWYDINSRKQKEIRRKPSGVLQQKLGWRYRVVSAHRNWHIESAGWKCAGFLHWGFRNPLAAIWAVS